MLVMHLKRWYVWIGAARIQHLPSILLACTFQKTPRPNTRNGSTTCVVCQRLPKMRHALWRHATRSMCAHCFRRSPFQQSCFTAMAIEQCRQMKVEYWRRKFRTQDLSRYPAPITFFSRMNLPGESLLRNSAHSSNGTTRTAKRRNVPSLLWRALNLKTRNLEHTANFRRQWLPTWKLPSRTRLALSGAAANALRLQL